MEKYLKNSTAFYSYKMISKTINAGLRKAFYSSLCAGLFLTSISSLGQLDYRKQLEDNSKLKVLSWNLENFGPKKGHDTALIAAYSGIMTNYDLIFLQEITDADESAVRELDRAMKGYSRKLSSRAGFTAQKEQYLVFCRNTKKFEVVDFKDFNPDKEKRWVILSVLIRVHLWFHNSYMP